MYIYIVRCKMNILKKKKTNEIVKVEKRKTSQSLNEGAAIEKNLKQK